MKHTEPTTIGSFFSSPEAELLSALNKPPWENREPIVYVQTGRQALAAIANYYSAEGRTRILVPEYLCESMLMGFDPNNWEIATYRIDDNLTTDTLDMANKVVEPLETVILSVSYFGNEPTQQHVEVIKKLQKKGTRIIEDETHRVLGKLEPIGDVAIASLRKVLPVAEGAYIRGHVSFEIDEAGIDLGWEAMDVKASGDHQRARTLYSLANRHLVSQIYPPLFTSSRTRDTINRLNYALLREKRQHNSAVLKRLLTRVPEIDIVNNTETPSHLVIRIPEAKRVQEALSKAGIYCPIHWPRPESLKSVNWRDDLLSLPVDHRYNAKDMQRIIEELEEVI